jgi:hypothetical protein
VKSQLEATTQRDAVDCCNNRNAEFAEPPEDAMSRRCEFMRAFEFRDARHEIEVRTGAESLPRPGQDNACDYPGFNVGNDDVQRAVEVR